MTLAPAGGAAKPGSTGIKQAAFLCLLTQLLALDAGLVLSPAQQASSYLLKSYLEILNMRCGSPFHRVHMCAVPIALTLFTCWSWSCSLLRSRCGMLHCTYQEVKPGSSLYNSLALWAEAIELAFWAPYLGSL